MHSVLYIVWFAIPSLFFLLSLWAKLERASGSSKNENPKDLFNQGLFTLGCVFVCVIIDTWFLADIIEGFLGDFLPIGFYQAFLLPCVLLLAAKIVGPSRKILIPHTGKTNRTTKRRR